MLCVAVRVVFKIFHFFLLASTTYLFLLVTAYKVVCVCVYILLCVNADFDIGRAGRLGAHVQDMYV